MRGFNEPYIAGLASGYICYLQSLEEDEMYDKSVEYITKLVNIVDSNMIQV